MRIELAEAELPLKTNYDFIIGRKESVQQGVKQNMGLTMFAIQLLWPRRDLINDNHEGRV